jgi:hypothetical protein
MNAPQKLKIRGDQIGLFKLVTLNCILLNYFIIIY